MKNKLKSVLAGILLGVCALTCTACKEAKSIIGIEKNTYGNKDTYTIIYSDNTTYDFTVTNGQNGIDGKDGEDGVVITVTDMYEEWKKTVAEGDDDSFDAFLKKYLTVQEIPSISQATVKAINSAVAITSTFNYTRTVGGFWNSTEEDYDATSAGSGVIIIMSDEDKQAGNAYICTNYHVVYDSTSKDENGISKDIKVYLYGMYNDVMAIPATYVGGSMTYDIAVLKIENSEVLKNSNAVAATIARDNVTVSDTVIAVGNPEGQGLSVTCGIVSVESESITMTLSDKKTEGQFRVIRVDTPVNPGNSGGGLFNDKGELVGIVNAKLTDEKVDNIGYAIPNEVSMTIFENILNNCNGTDSLKPKIARLGLTVQSYGYENYYDYDTQSIKAREKIVAIDTTETGIARASGFTKKDIVLSAVYNGHEYTFTRSYDLTNFVLTLNKDSVVDFKVSRPKNLTAEEMEEDTLFFAEKEYEEVTIRVTFNENYIFTID